LAKVLYAKGGGLEGEVLRAGLTNAVARLDLEVSTRLTCYHKNCKIDQYF
jgi:hypothetical protein